MATILVVDDDSRTIEQLTLLIQEAGHTPDFLLESSYLREKLAQQPVDLLLLDVNMPEVDGLTLLKRMKSDPLHRDLPVIMVTGDTDEKLTAACFEYGATDYVVKPIRRLEFLARLQSAINAQAQIAAIQAQKNDLLRAKAFIETILDNTDDAICVVDADNFTILEVNRLFLAQAGLGRDEVVGHPCYEKGLLGRLTCLGCEQPDGDCLVAEAARENGRSVRDSVLYGPDGQRRYIHMVANPIRTYQAGQRARQVVYQIRDITQQRLLEDRLKHLAFHDPLTGLPNRQLFFDRFQQAMAQAKRHDQLMAILFLDLDHFKEINDDLGHGIGDLLLQEAARRLSACVRSSDTVARMGGDEFTALLSNVNARAHVRLITDKIVRALSSPFHLGGHECVVTVSIGVSLYPLDGTDQEMLLRQADAALYNAKAAGRNAVHFCTGEGSTDDPQEYQLTLPFSPPGGAEKGLN